MGNLFKQGLQSGSFQIVARVIPPRSTNLANVSTLAASWKGKVNSILVADNPSATLGVSSLVAAERLVRDGHDVIVTLSCRDRNRMALGSVALGAAALDIESILCVSGDHFNFGDNPAAKPVYDLDSVQLIGMLRHMQNGSGAAESNPAEPLSFFLGAAVRATAEHSMPHLMKARKKIAAGVEFLITLPIFAIKELEPVLSGLSGSPAKILAGVLLPSYEQIQGYQDGSIPGTLIPEDLVRSWKDAGKDAFISSSATHVKKLIAELKSSGKVAGVCISATGRESEIEGLV
ncbi:MAG: methylenetetrahydrofolate reductase [Thermodesulfobacteriota bacterium]